MHHPMRLGEYLESYVVWNNHLYFVLDSRDAGQEWLLENCTTDSKVWVAFDLLVTMRVVTPSALECEEDFSVFDKQAVGSY